MTSRSLLLLLLVVLAAVATTRAAPQPQDAAHSRAKRFLLGWDLDDYMRRVQARLQRAWENSANLWRRLLGFAIQNHIKPGQAVVYQYVSPPGRAQVRIIDLKHGQHHGKGQERHEEPHEGVHKHGEHHEGVHKHGEHHEGVHEHGEHHEGVHKHGEHHEGVHKHGEHHEGGNDGGKRQEQSKSGEQSAAKKSKKGFNLHWDGEKLHFLVPGTHKYTSWLRVVENKHSHTVPLSEIAKHLANVKAGDLTAKIIGKKLSELQLELAVSGKDNKNTTIKIPLEKLIKESDKRNGEPSKNGKLIKLAQQELPSNVQKVPAAASRTVKEV